MPQQPSKAQQAGEGLKALQGIVKKSEEANKKNPNTPKKSEPPAIDTDSVGGFLKSVKDRLGYAVYGPSKEDK